MSVPKPTKDPCKASSVPSPPVDPPGENSGLQGFVVSPQRGFSVSAHWQYVSHLYVPRLAATNHDTLREVGLGNDNGAHTLQHLDEGRIFRGRCKGSTHIADGGVDALHVELIFQCYGNTMQRAFQPAGLFPFEIQLPRLL